MVARHGAARHACAVALPVGRLAVPTLCEERLAVLDAVGVTDLLAVWCAALGIKTLMVGIMPAVAAMSIRVSSENRLT